MGNSRAQTYGIRTAQFGPIYKSQSRDHFSKRLSKIPANVLEPYCLSMYTLSMVGFNVCFNGSGSQDSDIKPIRRSQYSFVRFQHLLSQNRCFENKLENISVVYIFLLPEAARKDFFMAVPLIGGGGVV